MKSEWIEIASGYSINEEGLVRNDLADHLLKRSLMTNKEPAVSFRVDGRLVRRQVISLMAETWMEPHEYERFDTPMHLDGDRQNCHVMNLVFRPRWFVIAYNRDCLEDLFPDWNAPFTVLELREDFPNAWECARSIGCLQKDIPLSLLNQTPLFPGGYTLEFI